jgi:galactokinase
MSDIRDDVAEAFGEVHGRTPLGIWSAPGRVNLIGEHTDYNEGFVLPLAINRRTVVALAPREDSLVRVASGFADELAEASLPGLDPRHLGGWAAYPLGVAWALGEFGADLAAVPGVDLMIESTVPVGAGLSSSAALLCAVAVALDEVWQLGFDRTTLARVGRLAENAAVGAPTGIMDEFAALFGRRDAAILLDCRSLAAEVVELGLPGAGLELLVIDTGVAHSHATGGYASRRASCERAATTLGVPSLREIAPGDLSRARAALDDETFRRVRHVVTENQRVLDTAAALRSDGPLAIGELMDASHASLRDDFEVSTPELDLAVDTARAGGAIGARLTGGGFGGAAIALVPGHAVSRVQVALDGAFAEHGFTPPTTFTVEASGAAARDR